MDPISDVFTALQVENVLYGRVDYGAPWGIHFPAGHASFGMVVRGHCWLTAEGLEKPVSLAGGDCFLLPRGVPYSLRDDERTPTIDIEEAFRGIDSAKEPLRYGGKGRTTTMVSGCFTFDEYGRRAVVDLLPSFIHIQADEPQSAALEMTTRLLAAEMQQNAVGSQIVVNRLVDVFFLQAIRFHMSRHSGCTSKWLRAVGDPQVGKVLTAMHQEIDRPWSVEQLASTGGMSRAGFALRFKQLVGEAPLEYLTRWRMYKASRLLRDPDRKILQVAASVGYDSDAAFSRAFKRVHGVAPGAYRKATTSIAATA
jgi:AraC-like DNA-binding protein